MIVTIPTHPHFPLPLPHMPSEMSFGNFTPFWRGINHKVKLVLPIWAWVWTTHWGTDTVPVGISAKETVSSPQGLSTTNSSSVRGRNWRPHPHLVRILTALTLDRYYEGLVILDSNMRGSWMKKIDRQTDRREIWIYSLLSLQLLCK